MAKKISEYDYLYISARIHALENRMLTRERMERMLDARTAEDAAKVLAECGYEEFSTLTPAGIESTLNKARLELFADLRNDSPDPGIVDVFCIKYDYHNAKVLLKSHAMGSDPAGLFIDAGRYPVKQLREDFDKEDLSRTSQVFRQSMEEAQGVLASSGDPQAADLILDRAYYVEMLQAAVSVKSPFLEGYVKLSIDSANLRAAVRSARMGRGVEFLKRVLLPGGSLSLDGLIAAATGGADLAARCHSTPLAAAGEAGAKAMEGGSLTEFERLCDNAVTTYLSQGKRVAFGEHPLIGYLYAREAELTTIRIILNGRLAGLDTEALRERLRDSYV